MSTDTFLIPEFETHHGMIVMFPFRTDIWREDAKHMQEYVIRLAQCIAKYEKVYFICRERDREYLQQFCTEQMQPVVLAYDDIWARDIGPTFIKENGHIRCLNWRFNSWGGVKEGSYFPWDCDNAFAKSIAQYLGLEVKDVKLVLEGGAILTDGAGTLFTTRSVLLNRNRNPFKSLAQVETILKEALHVDTVVWIKQGLALDETNGHIDNVLAVVRPHEVCMAWTDDRQNPNYSRVRNIEKQLLAQYDCTLHKIPLPLVQRMTEQESAGLTQNKDAIERREGDILPASYLNFNYVNGAILLPSFGCPEDTLVLEQFKKIFPDRVIEQIYSREPLLGGGGIHCILHEIPELG